LSDATQPKDHSMTSEKPT